MKLPLICHYFILSLLFGCTTHYQTILKNTSPEPITKDVNKQLSVPASVSIDAEKKDFISDISLTLSKYNVFSSIVKDPSKSELTLEVSHDTIADHHMKKGSDNSLFTDFFSWLSTKKPDVFDYSISVNAKLIYKNHVIADYSTMGSYHSEVPDSSDLKTKLEYTTSAVKLSYDHALTLLSQKIKSDREKIISAMNIRQ